MSLINAIVNSSDDLEFRVFLRNELVDLGIDTVIEVFPPLSPKPLPSYLLV